MTRVVHEALPAETKTETEALATETEAFENFPEARPRPRRSLSEARPRRGVGKASRDQKDLTKYYALDTLFLVRVTYK